MAWYRVGVNSHVRQHACIRLSEWSTIRVPDATMHIRWYVNSLEVTVLRRLKFVATLHFHINPGFGDKHRSRSHASNRHGLNPVILGVDIPGVRPLIRIRVHNRPFMVEHLGRCINRPVINLSILVCVARQRQSVFDLRISIGAVHEVPTATQQSRNEHADNTSHKSASLLACLGLSDFRSTAVHDLIKGQQSRARLQGGSIFCYRLRNLITLARWLNAILTRNVIPGAAHAEAFVLRPFEADA